MTKYMHTDDAAIFAAASRIGLITYTKMKHEEIGKILRRGITSVLSLHSLSTAYTYFFSILLPDDFLGELLFAYPSL
jgi:hypothetical protein